MLARLLEDRGLSDAEFRLSMRVNALLRKIAERRIEITDETLRAEHELQHGERVRIRHIQMPSLQEINEAHNRLLAGESFAAVARAYSKNVLTSADGGLLPPFTYVDPEVPPVMREIAFQLQAGEVSKPFRVDDSYQIIRVEERLPASSRGLESTRGELSEQLRERLVRERMKKLRDAMITQCRIRILDAQLRRAYNDRREQLTAPMPPPAQP
jgi:parvulin-like peptidyl-prolyl isomerase